MKAKTKKLLTYGAIAAGVVYFMKNSAAQPTGGGASTAIGAYHQNGSRHFVRRRTPTQMLRPS